jgi:hypothetical protein
VAYRLAIHPETARKLLSGETWAHVEDPEGPLVMRRKGPDSQNANRAVLTRVEVREIRGHHAAGMPAAQIARLYGVSKCTIRDIVKYRTWRDDPGE